MRDNKFMNQMGMVYLQARAAGKSAADACQEVREKFQKTEISDSTIRAYASKAAQHARVVRLPERPPRDDTRVVDKKFRLLAPLVDLLEAEAKKKGMNYSQLLNIILAKRYRKKI